MKKYILFFVVFFGISSFSFSQTAFYTESFETYDTNSLPSGWFKVNNLPIEPYYPYANWTVRDSGSMMPGIEFGPGRGQRSYDGRKSVAVTWWCVYDTAGNQSAYCDNWLITKKFTNIPADAFVSFYACGGATNYGDSIQVLVSTTDSNVSSFTHKLETIYWPNGSVFGNFSSYIYSLDTYAHQDIRIAFRYVSSNNGSNGFAVMMDYFQMFGTVGIQQIGTNVPTKFALQQNYPNPFNPTTKIKFDIAKATNVKIEIFNSLGQTVSTLVNDFKPAGYYETDFNASKLSSGVYFYRLTTDQFVDMKKMVVVK